MTQPYGDAAVATGAVTQPYGEATVARAVVRQPYSILAPVRRAVTQPYSIAGSRVVAAVEQNWRIGDTDPVRAVVTQPYSIIDGHGRLDRYDVTVTVNGREVAVRRVKIEAARERYCLSCEAVLGSQEDYARCRVLAPVEITVNGESFDFFIESRDRRRELGNSDYVIRGLSRTALLDAPYAEPVTSEMNGMASAIARALAPGYTVDWRTIDWLVPPNVLLPGNLTPLATIRELAAAAGAVVQTAPDGTLVIEPEYPVSVPNWPATPPDHVLTEAMDIETLAESFEHRPGYNRFLITDQMSFGAALRLEETALADNRHEIRVYQVPWDGGFELRHTGGEWVSLEPMGDEERPVDGEVVEFVQGSGRTRYPIVSISEMEWLRSPLGAVSHGEDGTLTSSVDGESLLKINYRTRCRLYLATNNHAEPVQFVAVAL